MPEKQGLTVIPGIGKSMEKDLLMLGIKKVADLKDKDPQKLYERLCVMTDTLQDRCVLYVFRCAVYYSHGGREGEKLKWWNWADGKSKKGRR
jgi:hypothetical protein